MWRRWPYLQLLIFDTYLLRDGKCRKCGATTTTMTMKFLMIIKQLSLSNAINGAREIYGNDGVNGNYLQWSTLRLRNVINTEPVYIWRIQQQYWSSMKAQERINPVITMWYLSYNMWRKYIPIFICSVEIKEKPVRRLIGTYHREGNTCLGI